MKARRYGPGRTVSGLLKRHLHLWPCLRLAAFLTIVLVCFTIAVDAYSLNRAFTWVSEELLHIAWDVPPQAVDHYRIEVAETALLDEPVSTTVSYAYVKRNDLSYEMKSGHSYLFRVQSVNPYGVLSGYSDSTALFIRRGGGIAETLAEDRPMEFALSQNYPNPFNNSTTISYQVPGSGAMLETTMIVYNSLGQNVRELVHGHMPAGRYAVVWDGLDERGNQVSSGNYIYLLTAGTYRVSKKMILMK